MADVGINPYYAHFTEGLVTPNGFATTSVGDGDVAVITSADLSEDATGGDHTAKDQVETRRCIFYCAEAGASTGNLIVKAGANPPSNREVLGDKVIPFTAGQTVCLAIESARYTQADGTIRIEADGTDFELGVVHLPDTL